MSFIVSLPTKYLAFKGLSKKERILFKSFLNLMKNELPYELVLQSTLKGVDAQPNIIVCDAENLRESSEQALPDLPSIIVSDHQYDLGADQLTLAVNLIRPVQWSDFRKAIMGLADPLEDNAVLAIQEEPVFVLDEQVEPQTTTSDDSELVMPVVLESMSSDDGFEEQLQSIEDEALEVEQIVEDVEDTISYMSTDESTVHEQTISHESILVIETDSNDIWEFSDAVFTDEQEPVLPQNGSNDSTARNQQLFSEQASFDVQSSVDFGIALNNNGYEGVEVDTETQEVLLEYRHSIALEIDEEYWLKDGEIIIDNLSFVYIRAAQGMVYSEISPGHWPDLLKRRSLSRIDLNADWQPDETLMAYPVSSLVWINTLVNETGELNEELDDDIEYMLEQWPPFHLLDLNNILLRLCTMLFVNAQTLDSLAVKSGYGRSIIRGLMNACYQAGYLKRADQIYRDKHSSGASLDGMLVKVKNALMAKKA